MRDSYTAAVMCRQKIKNHLAGRRRGPGWMVRPGARITAWSGSGRRTRAQLAAPQRLDDRRHGRQDGGKRGEHSGSDCRSGHAEPNHQENRQADHGQHDNQPGHHYVRIAIPPVVLGFLRREYAHE